LAAVGFAQSLIIGNPGPFDALLGAIASAGCFTLVMLALSPDRGIDGLGLGDLKFCAPRDMDRLAGVALDLLVASISALLVVLARALKTQRFDRFARLPFGPFLEWALYPPGWYW